jgi:uncharacterized membrane protein YphA (DoxX/SURF4 family)
MDFKNPFTIIRIGLALVFLSNGLAAFFAPAEFRELLANSFVSHLIPVSAFIIIIRLHDLLISLLLLSGWKLKLVAAWAMLWLLGVMTVLGNLFAILEHLGPFSIALAIFIHESRS